MGPRPPPEEVSEGARVSAFGVGWKGTICLECKERVDQDADLGFWFHVGDELPTTHEIIPCIPAGPADEEILSVGFAGEDE